MDAEERFNQKWLGYVKSHIHTDEHTIQIKMNRSARRVSVDGQIVIRTCVDGSLKYHKYQ